MGNAPRSAASGARRGRRVVRCLVVGLRLRGAVVCEGHGAIDCAGELGIRDAHDATDGTPRVPPSNRTENAERDDDRDAEGDDGDGGDARLRRPEAREERGARGRREEKAHAERRACAACRALLDRPEEVASVRDGPRSHGHAARVRGDGAPRRSSRTASPRPSRVRSNIGNTCEIGSIVVPRNPRQFSGLIHTDR